MKEGALDKATIFSQITNYFSNNITDVVYYDLLKNTLPQQGEIVFSDRFAGREYCFDNQFFRVVQIRLGCGQFGSHMYFLRHADGTLITAENQSFKKVPEQFVEDVESYFSLSNADEEEGYRLGYSLNGGKHLEIGFIIEKSSTPASPNTPFSLVITKSE